jgi:hypothetical protein
MAVHPQLSRGCISMVWLPASEVPGERRAAGPHPARVGVQGPARGHVGHLGARLLDTCSFLTRMSVSEGMRAHLASSSSLGTWKALPGAP